MRIDLLIDTSIALKKYIDARKEYEEKLKLLPSDIIHLFLKIQMTEYVNNNEIDDEKMDDIEPIPVSKSP